MVDSTNTKSGHYFLSAISVISLFIGFYGANIAQAATFQDVPADAWFSTYVEQLASAGILDTTQANYRPADSANRAEAAKILDEAAGLTMNASPGPTFKDVAPGAWYYQYVETAAKNGIVTGYTDAAGNLTGMFGPGDPVTREQFAKMAVKAFNMTQDTDGGPHFPDEATSSWSYPYVESLYNRSGIDGYPDRTFKPTNNLDRAEMAKIVINSMPSPTPRISNSQNSEQAVYDALDVVLDQSVQAPASIPKGATHVQFVCWNFIDGSVKHVIQSLTVHRIGTGSQNDFADVYLYQNQNTSPLTPGLSINSQTQTVQFKNIQVNLTPGNTTKLCLVADISPNAATADQNGFEINSVTDITTDALTVNGNFPAAGNLMTVGG